MPIVCSISIGKVTALHSTHQNGSVPAVYSAIHKTPISTLQSSQVVQIASLGVQGDEQSNLKVHGGINKAVYAYATEHYEFWKSKLVLHHHLESNATIEHGFLGENLTISGLLEDQVFIGDTWKINNLILEVTEFREPCFKLNMKMNFKSAAKMMAQSGYSGWYLKVIQEGQIKAGDEITVKPGLRQISIADQNTAFYRLKGQTELDF